MTAPARVGVAGAGYWGANLVRACGELGVLHAVADPDPQRLAAVRAAHPGVLATPDYSALLDAVDAVVIAAPAAEHAALALEAIRHRRHVFVEKPLALTLADARRVADAADAAGVTAFVGHVLLYHPAVRALLEAARSGAVGNVTHVRSRRLNLGKIRTHEDVWWSFAPHDVALCLALLGPGVTGASGSLQHARGAAVADFAYADLTFTGGRSAHVEVSWLDPNRSARLDAFGTRGVLTFEDSRAGATLVRRVYDASAPVPVAGPPEAIAFEAGEPLRLELEAFLACVAGGPPAPTSARAAVDVVAILEAVSAAARPPAVAEVAVA